MKTRQKRGRIKARRVWKRHPATRIKRSDKVYSRKRVKRTLKKQLKEELK